MAELESDFSSALAFSLDKLRLQVTLKNEQLQAIRAAYESRDVFVCLPTGYGKSLCYQVLPFMMDYKSKTQATSLVLHESHHGVHNYHNAGNILPINSGQDITSAVIVVSPLVALMEDQVSGLRKRGVNASIITASTSVSRENICVDRNLTLDSLFFVSPEALVTPRWRGVFDLEHFTRRIVAIAVDEAHCISKWSV